MHIQQLSRLLETSHVLVPGLENLITDYKKPVVFMLAKGIRKQSRIFRVLICISLRQCEA